MKRDGEEGGIQGRGTGMRFLLAFFFFSLQGVTGPRLYIDYYGLPYYWKRSDGFRCEGCVMVGYAIYSRLTYSTYPGIFHLQQMERSKEPPSREEKKNISRIVHV